LRKWKTRSSLPADILPLLLKRAGHVGLFPKDISNILLSAMAEAERSAFQFCEGSVQLARSENLNGWQVLPQLLEGEVGFAEIGRPERTEKKARGVLNDYLQDPDDSLIRQWFRIGYLNGGGPGQSVILERVKAATDKEQFDVLVKLVCSGGGQLCLHVPEFTKAILEVCVEKFPSDFDEVQERLKGSIWLRSQSYTNGVPKDRSILEIAEKNSARFAGDSILREFYAALVAREYEAEEKSKEEYQRRDRETFEF
jgi:hypothetical protein